MSPYLTHDNMLRLDAAAAVNTKLFRICEMCMIWGRRSLLHVSIKQNLTFRAALPVSGLASAEKCVEVGREEVRQERIPAKFGFPLVQICLDVPA